MTNAALITTDSLSGSLGLSCNNGMTTTGTINRTITGGTVTGNVSAMIFSHNNCVCRNHMTTLTRNTHRTNLGFWRKKAVSVTEVSCADLSLGREMMFVGHMTGMIGNNHHFSFDTLMIINSNGNCMNINLNGTTRMPRTVHGNVSSTGGGVMGMTVGGNAVPRDMANMFNTNHMFLGPTTRNANIVTNNPIHTMLRLMNIHGVLAGSLNSSGPGGVIHTAVRNLGSLGHTDRITRLHNGAIRRVCGTWWKSGG